MYFSTQNVDSSIRFEAWQAAIAGQCGPFRTDFGSLAFEGSIDARRVGGFDCARIAQTSKTVSRGEREIREGKPEVYFVIMQLSGKSRLEQCGTVAELAPGDSAVIDSALPCQFKFDGKNIQLSLHIPRILMHEGPVNWSDRLATILPQSTSALVGTLVRCSFEHIYSSDEAQESAVANALLGFLTTGWNERPRISIPSEPRNLIRAIQDYVLGHLENEHLCPAMIANVFRISERQLHRTFSNSGLSVSRWIRRSRLDRCAADFRDPHQSHKTITEIAFHWGFSDAAHFSRLFRAEFGQSPSTYRSEARPGQLSAAE